MSQGLGGPWPALARRFQGPGGPCPALARISWGPGGPWPALVRRSWGLGGPWPALARRSWYPGGPWPALARRSRGPGGPWPGRLLVPGGITVFSREFHFWARLGTRSMVTVCSIPAETKDGNYCSNHLWQFLDCARLLSVPFH